MDSPYLVFADERRRAEWSDGRVHAALRVVVLSAALWLYRQTGIVSTLTHLYRTREEQLRIYPANTSLRSVHEFWRGGDLRTRNLQPGVAREWEAWINSAFEYRGSMGIRTALYHSERDLGEHLHLQIGPFEPV